MRIPRFRNFTFIDLDAAALAGRIESRKQATRMQRRFYPVVPPRRQQGRYGRSGARADARFSKMDAAFALLPVVGAAERALYFATNAYDIWDWWNSLPDEPLIYAVPGMYSNYQRCAGPFPEGTGCATGTSPGFTRYAGDACTLTYNPTGCNGSTVFTYHATFEAAAAEAPGSQVVSWYRKSITTGKVMEVHRALDTSGVPKPMYTYLPQAAPNVAEAPLVEPRPNELGKPWEFPHPARQPLERRHPLNDWVPALEYAFPASPGAAVTVVRQPEPARHYNRPDGSKKGGSGLPVGMARAMKLFHTATELRDGVDALYEAMRDRAPITQKPGKAKSFTDRFMEVAENWDLLTDPAVAQEAAKNLMENEIEDRVIGRLFGGSWRQGRGALRDNYGASSWIDAAYNDPYGNRDGPGGSPTELFPWN